MHLPEAFVTQMQHQLGEEANQLFSVLDGPSPISIHLHPVKTNPQFVNNHPVPWHKNLGRYLEERPVFTLDPTFHAGSFYVQEASSMFIAQGFEYFFKPDQRSGLKVLDLCAAPGGKSTLLASLLPSDAFFLANEVIQSRYQILNHNLDKWGLPNTSSSNHDPDDFKALEGFFDFILVDAPCSGEGLFRKDENAREEWSEENVILCAGRQKRILQAAVPLLKKGGILAYSTCTYNDLENQENCLWLENEFNLHHEAIPLTSDWGIVSKERGYQFYPHKVRGEGFFCAFFKKE